MTTFAEVSGQKSLNNYTVNQVLQRQFKNDPTWLKNKLDLKLPRFSPAYLVIKKRGNLKIDLFFDQMVSFLYCLILT